jgi:hypothetical protein
VLERGCTQSLRRLSVVSTRPEVDRPLALGRPGSWTQSAASGIASVDQSANNRQIVSIDGRRWMAPCQTRCSISFAMSPASPNIATRLSELLPLADDPAVRRVGQRLCFPAADQA